MKHHLRNVHGLENGNGETSKSTTECKKKGNDIELDVRSLISIEHQNDNIIDDQIDINEDMEQQNDNESLWSPTIHDSDDTPPSPSISLQTLSPSQITWED